jgi:hypothetical protein
LMLVRLRLSRVDAAALAETHMVIAPQQTTRADLGHRVWRPLPPRMLGWD